MTFRVGQKVVFIGPNCPNNHLKQNVPVYGEVYTIRATAEITGIPALLLEEVHNEPRRWSNGCYELHIETKWFRPIVERKTDISFAHEILRKASKPARSPAISSPE